jgi:hypothetical protein
MTTDPNPYAPPEKCEESTPAGVASANQRTAIVSGIALVLACPILFAVVGGVTAAVLDRWTPGYYPAVFPRVEREFAGLVGLTHGILQGLVFGLVAGAVVGLGLGCFRQLRPTYCVRAMATVAACGIAFAAIGTAIGYAVAVALPDYYRSVFHGRSQPDFSPTDVGIGLGCSEGLIAGAVVGCVAALALAWRRHRRLAETN